MAKNTKFHIFVDKSLKLPTLGFSDALNAMVKIVWLLGGISPYFPKQDKVSQAHNFWWVRINLMILTHNKFDDSWSWAVLRSLLTIKKGTSPFNFQLNELFSMFPRWQRAITKFIQEIFRKTTRYGGEGIIPLITLNFEKALELLIINPMNTFQSL